MDRSQRLVDIGKTLDMWNEVALEGSFEDAMDALEAIVTLLDEGDLTLDIAVRCFETGTLLSARCQMLLEQAELRVSLLTAAAPQYDEWVADETSEFKSGFEPQ